MRLIVISALLSGISLHSVEYSLNSHQDAVMDSMALQPQRPAVSPASQRGPNYEMLMQLSWAVC